MNRSDSVALRPGRRIAGALALAALASLVISSGASAAPPVNDNWGSRQAIPGTLPRTVTGTNLQATTEGANEPAFTAFNHSKSVWYSFTPAANGPVRVSLCDSPDGFDSVLAVLTGGSLVALVELTSDDESCGGDGDGHPSSLAFQAVASTSYSIMVASWEEGANETLTPGSTFELDLTSEPPPANDSLANALTIPAAGGTDSIDDDNISATEEVGEPDHAGHVGGSSVWYTWTAPLTGIASGFACGNFDTLVAVYTGAGYPLAPIASDNDADNACGDGRQSSLTATFPVTAGEVYKLAIDGVDGAEGSFTAGFVSAPPPPANDSFASALTLASANAAAADGTTAGATLQASEPNHNPAQTAVDFPRRSVWFRWTAPASGSVVVDTCDGAFYDTVLAVYSGAGLGSLSQLGYDDDSCAPSDPNFIGSVVTLNATQGTTYWIAVDAYSDGGPFHLDLALTPDPVSPPGGGGGDSTAPETMISDAPPKKTTKRSVRIGFTSNEAGSSFECSLNGKAFAACDSGDKFKGKQGRNRLAVRAEDAAGNVDATPATTSWTRKGRKRK